jgi:integrase
MARTNKGPRVEKNEFGIYEIRWTKDGRSKRLSTRTESLPEAQRFLAGWLLEEISENGPAMNVGKILDMYLHEHVEEQVIDQARAICAARKLDESFGELDPSDLTADRIAAYKRERKAAGRKDGTIRRELVTLIAALNYARKQRKVSAADIPSISLPPMAPAKDLWLDEREEGLFWDMAAATSNERLSRVHRFVAIGMETAARRRSIERLRWDQIDLEHGLIHFHKDGRRQKNKRRVPVPVSDRLRPVLERAYQERGGTCYVLDSPVSIQREFVRLVKQFAAVNQEKAAKMTCHTMRHTWATLAARAGVDLYQIAGVLGDTLATVERNYLHHAPEHLRAAINFKNAALKSGEMPVLSVGRDQQQPPTTS